MSHLNSQAPSLPTTSPSLPTTAIDEAVEWVTLLMSGESTAADHLRWQVWRTASAEHALAWEKVESIFGRIKTLDSNAAYNVLSPYSAHSASRQQRRRAVIRALLLGGLVLGAGGVATHSDIVLAVSADYRTRKGESRTVTLDDGTRLELDTDTAIAVRFDDMRRNIRLLQGQVAVNVGTRAGKRLPALLVSSAHGTVTATDAAFSVRLFADHTQCAVRANSVNITPATQQDVARVLREGEQACFTRDDVGPTEVSALNDFAWMQGSIVADNMRLADLAAEVDRYRPGVIRVSPAVGQLRISGVYPTADTDRILASIARTLPVKVRHWTRYWVVIDARKADAS